MDRKFEPYEEGHALMQTNSDTKPQCAWCHKSQDAVAVLIATPTDVYPRSYICDECVGLCREIIEAGETQLTTCKQLGGRHVGQQWEYCELSQLGSNVTVRFYGRNLPSVSAQGWVNAMQVLGNAEWEAISVIDASARGGLEAKAYLKRPKEPGRDINDAATRL